MMRPSSAKDIFKEEGAHDISSTGEAHSDVKAKDVSNTTDTRVREVDSEEWPRQKATFLRLAMLL